MKIKKREKYTKILAAAKALILRDGTATIGTTKVAKAVGMAQSSLYIYFKNKDDLLRQLDVPAQVNVQRNFAKHITPNADLTTAVHGYIDAMYDFARTNIDTFQELGLEGIIPQSTRLKYQFSCFDKPKSIWPFRSNVFFISHLPLSSVNLSKPLLQLTIQLTHRLSLYFHHSPVKGPQAVHLAMDITDLGIDTGC